MLSTMSLGRGWRAGGDTFTIGEKWLHKFDGYVCTPTDEHHRKARGCSDQAIMYNRQDTEKIVKKIDQLRNTKCPVRLRLRCFLAHRHDGCRSPQVKPEPSRRAGNPYHDPIA